MNRNETAMPVAISQLGEGIKDSQEHQVERAIEWLLDQSGGSVTVITPRMEIESEALKQLIKCENVTHCSWRSLKKRSLRGRVLLAWPDRQHLNNLWGVNVDALAVIELDLEETKEWIEDNKPLLLLHDGATPYLPDPMTQEEHAPLPNGVEEILKLLARKAAGYTNGLKWNEQHKLKADIRNRPKRWVDVTGDQVRAKCRELGMPPNDIDKITEIIESGKEGHRFRVEKQYRNFYFPS